MILAIRTDKPEAELYVLKEDGVVVDRKVWLANRELSNTLLSTIEYLLSHNELRLDDVTQILVYQGPGSFTGLRIGITIANTIGFVLRIPVVGVRGEDWLLSAKDVSDTQKDFNNPVVPHYGSEANVTPPRK